MDDGIHHAFDRHAWFSAGALHDEHAGWERACEVGLVGVLRVQAKDINCPRCVELLAERNRELCQLSRQPNEPL